ncbi:c-type cytochrome [Paraburkholderia caribensis]|uniref:c-type cytochrome n=1 Tax=Paraburkholderia caribensis TaxID=75105 RepID=UPI001D06971E|nr:cytochrome c [Paraburkholderia caribensis]
MLKRILIGVAAVLLIGVIGAFYFAWRPTIAPISPPVPSAFARELVMRGEVLAAAGFCAECHTAKGGRPFAGGYAMRTGFGTVYSTNITPDPETGIGTWSEEAFRRAMQEGVARDGSHLFPAFPYDHFTRMSDADISALYAYFMTREPVNASAQENTLPFPLGIRALQAGWKLLFFRPGRFETQPARGPQWNRGAYLAEGISHCSACHTPRNGLGAEERGHAYSGAAVDNWLAPPLTKANPSPVPWTQKELFAYLRTGISRFHGTVMGPMSPVVHKGLDKLPDSDIEALAVYFADINDAAGRGSEVQPAIQRALVVDRGGRGQQYDPAVRLYTAACASCHYNGGNGPHPLRPDLAIVSAVSLSDPTNLIQVIFYGVGAQEGAPGVVMPGFIHGFSDADVARIAAYLRATHTNLAPWPDLEKKVAAIRAQGRGQE